MLEKIALTNFAISRHFKYSKTAGTKITNKTTSEFLEYLNLRIIDSQTSSNGNQKYRAKILNGYADFCKLIIIENFTDAKIGSLKIDIANHQYLRCGYSSRRESELPVFSRWFELPVAAPVADYLVIVVYSREQLLKEHEAEIKKNPNIQDSNDSGKNSVDDLGEFELSEEDKWAVVAILGQSHDNEEPMQPITIMRNALGVKEGGSSVELNKELYMKSVAFWSEHAIVSSR